MRRKSTISSIFIYAVSALVIILVVYFGYRGIAGIQRANEESLMERFQLRMRADMGQLSIRYGTSASFNYDVIKKYSKMCFVDLFNESSERNSTLQQYPLIWDSIESRGASNVFLIGESFLSFDAGKLRVRCAPSVFCINITRNKAQFRAEGGGDSVIITCG